MKRYFIITGIIGLFLIGACSKSTTPQPTSGDTENNNNNTGGNGNTGSTGNNGGSDNQTYGFDPTFNAPTGFTSNTVFEQPDGKIILDAYTMVNSQTVVKIYRLNSNGSIDNSFNIDVDKTWLIKNLTGIFVLADGKILLGGLFTVKNKSATLVRLNGNGAIDYTYTPPISSTKYENVGFQRTADGKVFVSYTIPYTGSAIKTLQPGIIRLNNEGTLDSSFILPQTSSVQGNSGFTSIVPLLDGKIFIAGNFSMGSGSSMRQNVARINADGSIDQTFNFVETISPVTAIVRKIGVQNSTGKVIITGDFTGFTNPDERNATYNYYNIARLNVDGSFDQTFKAVNEVTFGTSSQDIVTLSDDRILVDGFNVYSANLSFPNSIMFFSKDGGIDNSLTFPVEHTDIGSIFKEKTDQFLLVGSIEVNGKYFPIVRYKRI